MTDFTVRWSIQIEADNPVEAAAQALLIQQDRQSTATHFMVEDPNGAVVSVDLSEEG